LPGADTGVVRAAVAGLGFTGGLTANVEVVGEPVVVEGAGAVVFVVGEADVGFGVVGLGLGFFVAGGLAVVTTGDGEGDT
jgi:hypothetical protein